MPADSLVRACDTEAPAESMRAQGAHWHGLPDLRPYIFLRGSMRWSDFITLFPAVPGVTLLEGAIHVRRGRMCRTRTTKGPTC